MLCSCAGAAFGGSLPDRTRLSVPGRVEGLRSEKSPANSAPAPEGMSSGTIWRQLADDVALISFPWRTLGVDFKRNVTLLRLRDGRIVVHSSAPFLEQDVANIRRFGQPAWIAEATLMHDTFAKEAHNAFPDLPYLAPEGFAEVSGISTRPLCPSPSDWAGEIDVLKIGGVRSNEHALFHRLSRTLVVADLFFSFPKDVQAWPRFFVHHCMRLPRLFGVSALFRLFVVRDKHAFNDSINAVLALDFDRLVVAHSEPIEKHAKRPVEQAIRDLGLLS